VKEKGSIEKFLQSIALLLILLMLFGAGYFAGAFFTSFNDGLCYSSSINLISNKALDVAISKNDGETDKFKQDMGKIPLWGYETNCPELLKFLEERYPNIPDTRTLTK